MTKQRAIYLYCLECSGGNAIEVTFCHLIDCPLWQYRCGYHVKTNRYKRRIEHALIRNKSAVEELVNMDIDMAKFKHPEVAGYPYLKKSP